MALRCGELKCFAKTMQTTSVRGGERSHSDGGYDALALSVLPWDLLPLSSNHDASHLLYCQAGAVKRAKAARAIGVDSQRAVRTIHIHQELQYAAFQLTRWSGWDSVVVDWLQHGTASSCKQKDDSPAARLPIVPTRKSPLASRCIVGTAEPVLPRQMPALVRLQLPQRRGWCAASPSTGAPSGPRGQRPN